MRRRNKGGDNSACPLEKLGGQQIKLYLCHVCEGEVSGYVFLVVLDNFKEFFLPLHRHFELDVVASIVVEGEGHNERLGIGELFIWDKQCSIMLTFRGHQTVF